MKCKNCCHFFREKALEICRVFFCPSSVVVTSNIVKLSAVSLISKTVSRDRCSISENVHLLLYFSVISDGWLPIAKSNLTLANIYVVYKIHSVEALIT